ncbi:MAG: 3-hydroxyacyl-CoA dehydrogenase NAD-binding protein [Bryobacterales bacterium]|nr:3-hydroxyacyl-CoA dehydrogenase NAD-binding protein [Bryobacterales bacterium]
MGSRIAAHIANAGVPVLLLDMPSTGPDRNAIVASALQSLAKSKPPAFFEPEVVGLIRTGNFEDDMHLIADCDWIIEAVSEDMEIKRALLANVSAVRRNGSVVTTNTSGLPVAQIAAGMPDDFRRHWLGTHFFNPPRYMRLLELIATEETDPGVVDAVAEFADTRLGKTVVRAKDTPNFIGNRIGTFTLLNSMRVMQEMNLTIEQVDALTSAPLGWPKTGTFRLCDLIGIDVLVHIASNFFSRVSDERADASLPEFMTRMMDRRWIGDKAGQGFYKKQRGQEQRIGLDWKTLEYRPSENPTFGLLRAAKKSETLSGGLQFLLGENVPDDQAGAFYRQILPDLWNYAAHRVPEICDDIVAIDAAMKSGFNWEMGPFEMWDAAGVPGTAERMKASGVVLAPAVRKLLDSGHTSWYREGPTTESGKLYFDVLSGGYKPVRVAAGVSSVATLKRRHGAVKENAGASVVDLGDGIACLEFHTKMNAIDGDILSLVTETLAPDGQTISRFEGFVVSGDAANFSAGANLTRFLQAIQQKNWMELDGIIRAFQRMTQSIKFCLRPVVVAPFGLCLGGGAEVALHAAARQAHVELTIGLVEAAVGLVPAGGGCKEMALRAGEDRTALLRHFETLCTAQVSTSAAEARRFGFLSTADGITMNRERLLTDAKSRVRTIVDGGYSSPAPRKDIPAAGNDMLTSLNSHVQNMRSGQHLSDHDVIVAGHIADILCGGRVSSGKLVCEQDFLDLEREAFLSLCGEKKTEERIAFTLKTGKPLKN